MNLKELASENKPAVLRAILVFTLILLAAALRLGPHPLNFTPVGAIALFAGAAVRDRRMAFLFPVLLMLATDVIIGFNKLSPLVYASFLLSVVIGRIVVGGRLSASQRAKRESEPGSATDTKARRLPRIATATFLGSLQFFLITNFGVWAVLGTYPRTAPGLAACYIAGLPLFWNTFAGDAVYTALLFGAFFMAEHLAPSLGLETERSVPSLPSVDREKP